MLATAGIIAASFVRLPGDIYTTGTVLEAHNNAVASGSMLQILIWTSLFEIISSPAVARLGHIKYDNGVQPPVFGTGVSDRAPGDFSFDPLGLGKNPAALERYKVNELKNGRLAMLAFSGIITQSVLYNKPDFPFF
jgi:hypothetical protein